MRREFADELLLRMRKNKDIWLVTADLGYKMWDNIRDEFPDRFINTGAAEQTAADICVGLAMSGKIPFYYSITPFLIYRSFETLRTYINHEKWPVKLIGGGRNKDYAHDGFSHDASDVELFLGLLPSIDEYYPKSKEEIPQLLDIIIASNNPSFISLKR